MENTMISTVTLSHNTGGNVLNDIITLKNGYIIRISEDGLSVYKNEEADTAGEYECYTNFND